MLLSSLNIPIDLSNSTSFHVMQGQMAQTDYFIVQLTRTTIRSTKSTHYINDLYPTKMVNPHISIIRVKFIYFICSTPNPCQHFTTTIGKTRMTIYRITVSERLGRAILFKDWLLFLNLTIQDLLFKFKTN